MSEKQILESELEVDVSAIQSCRKSTTLWSAKIIFLQLFVLVCLAFLLPKMYLDKVVKIISIAPNLSLIPLCLVCIYPAIALNQNFLTRNPSYKPFTWGYFNSLLLIVVGILSSGLWIWLYSQTSGNHDIIIWGILLTTMGIFLYQRNRWAWVVFSILNLNPVSWIINGIYLKNRWREMRGGKDSKSQPKENCNPVVEKAYSDRRDFAQEGVGSVLSAFEEEEKKLTKINPVDNGVALNLIRNDVVVMIKDVKATNESLEDGISPRDLVYVIITNAISDPLSHGLHHTYRGVLGFKGKYLLNLWDYSVGQMEASGFYSAEKAKSDKAWIRNRIKEVG